MGVNGKDKKSTAAERKKRLAAELRANLKRRKAKTSGPGTSRGKEPDEAGGR